MIGGGNREGRTASWAPLSVLILCATMLATLPVRANEPAPPAHGEGGGEAVPEVGPYFRALPDLLVNLKSSTNRPVFLKISLAVETPTPEDRAALDHAMPFVLDSLQFYLRAVRPEDVQGSQGMYRLRSDLLRRISLAITPARVTDVLFKEMLVQ